MTMKINPTGVRAQFAKSVIDSGQASQTRLIIVRNMANPIGKKVEIVDVH